MDVLRSANFFSTFSRSLFDAPPPPKDDDKDVVENDASLLVELIDIICEGRAEADVSGDAFVGVKALTTAPTALALLIFCV
jgi:hypothetical protein